MTTPEIKRWIDNFTAIMECQECHEPTMHLTVVDGAASATCDRCGVIDLKKPAPPGPAVIEINNPPARAFPIQCVHLGPETGEVKLCPSCRGTVKLKMFACGHPNHPDGTTLVGCRTCPDAEAKPARHLLMHLWPVTGNKVWQLRVQQLKQRWSLFDGIKVVSVVLGPETDSLDAVRREFDDPSIQFMSLPNSHQQEMASWAELWGQLRGQTGQVFYCHGKQTKAPIMPEAGVHIWTDIMFQSCLDFWPLVERRLKRHMFAGSFLRSGGRDNCTSTWHYAGTFFWANLKEVGDRWKEAHRVWWGSELWPGQLSDWRDGGELFNSDYPGLALYSDEVMAEVQKEFEQWKVLHRKERTAFDSVASSPP